MSKQYEIEAAYFQGLREGFDPEVAADLGIPMTAEDAEHHIASAEEVAAALGQVSLPQTIEKSPEHQEWIDSLHLTHPVSEGPISYRSAEEREQATTKKEVVASEIRPLGDYPSKES